MEKSIANGERPPRESSDYDYPHPRDFAPSGGDSDILNMSSVSAEVVVKSLVPQKDGNVQNLVTPESNDEMGAKDADGRSDILCSKLHSLHGVVNDEDNVDSVAAVGFCSGSRDDLSSKTLLAQSDSSIIKSMQYLVTDLANQENVYNCDNDANVQKSHSHVALDFVRNSPSGQNLSLGNCPCEQKEKTRILERVGIGNRPHIGPVCEGRNGEGAMLFDSDKEDGGLTEDTMSLSAPSSLDCMADNDHIDKQLTDNVALSCKVVELPTHDGSSTNPGDGRRRSNPLCEKASTNGSTSASTVMTSLDVALFSGTRPETKVLVEENAAIRTMIGMDNVYSDRRIDFNESDALETSFRSREKSNEGSHSHIHDANFISSFPPEGQRSTMEQEYESQIIVLVNEDSFAENGRDDRTTIIRGNSCEIEVTVQYHQHLGQSNRKRARCFRGEQQQEQPTATSKSQRNSVVTTNGRRRGEQAPELESSIRKRSFEPRNHLINPPSQATHAGVVTQLANFDPLGCLDNEPWALEEQLPCFFSPEDESDILSEHFSRLKGSVSFEITDLTLREEDMHDSDPCLENPSRRVKFADPLVSHVRERPRTTAEEKDALFYSFEDTQMFRLEYFYEMEEEWDDLVFLDACDAVGTLAKKTYDLLLYVPDALYNTSCHY